MQTANFSFEQFVDNATITTGFSLALSSIREITANQVFFNPGLVSPSSLMFSYNGNMVVTVNAPAPFKCLFLTGAYAYAYGITAGVLSSTYQVSFASLVPGSGSITAYMVATYLSLQSGPIIINGPPPGHPDFSSSFNAYLAYTSLIDSVNIFATTTAPDNVNTLELARITLISGQTQITSGELNTSFQVLASLNIPAESVTLAGDVTGPASNTYLNAIQSVPVVITTLAPGSVLTYNGAKWTAQLLPSAFPPTGPAGGDLFNSYPNPNVGGIRGIAINLTPPTNGQSLQYNSSLNQLVYSYLSVVAQAGSLSLSADITGIANNTATSILSVNITLPVGTWRIQVSINNYFETFAGNGNANPIITSWVGDNLGNDFSLGGNGAYVPQNVSINSGVSSTGISPLYNGLQTITLTSYVFFSDPLGGVSTRKVLSKPLGSKPPPSSFTYISYTVIPANA